MKRSTALVILLLTFVIISCQKNPLSYVNSLKWDNQRNVLNITFANQVGKPTITRIDSTHGSITVSINVDAVPNLSAIKIEQLELSYGAKASVKKGDVLNFQNSSQSTTIKVTSPTGLSRVYTVTATSFKETLIGSYSISDLTLYGGTGPEYGGGAVFKLSDKSWDWPKTDGPSAELDNTLVFKMTGVTPDGNTYGTINNEAGPDGLYANFMFADTIDVNHFYRKIPEGTGKWLRNYQTGMITFTFPDGHTTSGKLIKAGTEDLGNGLSKTTKNEALEFILNGTDNWKKIYSDYDKIVARPRILWIDVNKQ